MSAPRYVFAGGGTGGHLFPGLAVAAALRAREPNAEIAFFTTSRKLDAELLAPTGYEQIPQTVRPLSSRPWRWPAFLHAWRQSVDAAKRDFRQREPWAVLGLGGYAAGPPVVAARKLGIRTAILNPDAVPGKANRFLAGRADLVVLQWGASKKFFKTGTACQALGCPIRDGFAGADPAIGRRVFDLAPDQPVVLVTGASQGARSINQSMRRIWPEFLQKHPEWQLLHLTGAADEAETRQFYETTGTRAIVRAFTYEMPLALAAADIVIARAGASTLAELTALGKPAILLPYPYHRDRHQHANARVLVDAGAAIMVEDYRSADANAGPLLAALTRLADADARKRMAQAAATLGRLNAAETVAAWLRGERA